MKSLFKRFYNTAHADQEKEAETMAIKEGQPEMAADKHTAELAALLESATTTLAATQTKLSEITAMYEGAKAALAAADEAKATLVAQAAEKRLAARKEAIVASIGTSQASTLLAATENLDDASFNAVVSAMAKSFDAEASTAAFKEVGISAKTDASAVVQEPEESAEALALKAKYNKSK